MNLIAQPCGAFEVQLVRRSFHTSAEFADQFVTTPFEHFDCIGNVLRIGRLRHEADTGTRTALNLKLQARTRTIREIGILAGSQPKYFLQKGKRVTRCARTWIRAKKFSGQLTRTAIETDARKILLCRKIKIRKALVVTQSDVVPRPMLFDEVVFEQQSLDVG